jgi:hypothetical protein
MMPPRSPNEYSVAVQSRGNKITDNRGGALGPVKKPSARALALGLIPYAAMCLSVSLWDRIYPMLFGIPFNLFWLISWIVLSAVCMRAAYWVEIAREKKDGRTE